MKNLGLLLFVLLASLAGASAQVTVEVITEQDQFLPNETLPVAVRVVNRSGQTLHLGKDEDWLTFSIEAKDGFIVFKSGEVPVVQEFDLDSSKMATKHVDLAPYFNITKPGRYTVTAAVKIKDWNAQMTSEAKTFDIVSGVKLWEQEFGVPSTSGTQPEVRRYTLQKAVYKSTTKLYLRLTDGTGSQVFKVIPVGPMVSFSRVEPQLDKLSNLHLAYQTGSHTFLYSMIDPQGEVVQRQTFDYTTTRPRLKMDDSGKISVVGGVRRFADNDIPASGELSSTDVVKPPKP